MSFYEHEGSEAKRNFLARFWDQLKSVILSYEAPMFVCVLLNLNSLIHVVSLVGSIIRSIILFCFKGTWKNSEYSRQGGELISFWLSFPAYADSGKLTKKSEYFRQGVEPHLRYSRLARARLLNRVEIDNCLALLAQPLKTRVAFHLYHPSGWKP